MYVKVPIKYYLFNFTTVKLFYAYYYIINDTFNGNCTDIVIFSSDLFKFADWQKYILVNLENFNEKLCILL